MQSVEPSRPLGWPVKPSRPKVTYAANATYCLPVAKNVAATDPVTNSAMKPVRRDYSLVGPEGQRALERGLTEAEWYRTPVDRKDMKKLMQRSDLPAIRDTIIWIGLLVLLAVLGVRTWLSWWSLPIFFAYGVLYGSASDSRWHECGHGTAFKTRWMNSVVYNIACFMIMRNPVEWRWSHTRHHTDTIIVGRDPEIAIQRPPSMFRFFAAYFGFFDVWNGLSTMTRNVFGQVSPSVASFVPESERRRLINTARVWFAIYVITVAIAITSRSVVPLMLIGLPRLYGAWHHVLTGFTQHGGLADDVTDHRRNTRSVRMNPISRFVYWNMNYHVEHHMFPMVPYHALPKLHELIKDDLPPMLPSIFAAYREFVPVLLQQRKDATVIVARNFPNQSQRATASSSNAIS
jgi:fatty acid desaturase